MKTRDGSLNFSLLGDENSNGGTSNRSSMSSNPSQTQAQLQRKPSMSGQALSSPATLNVPSLNTPPSNLDVNSSTSSGGGSPAPPSMNSGAPPPPPAPPAPQ
jgi:hypothetical protein